MSYTTTEKDEQRIDLDFQDKKVGSILAYFLRPSSDISSNENEVNRKELPIETDRCYVYHSEDLNEPYYFAKMGTRVFVIDKKRIDYFPDGVEPTDLGSIKSYYRNRSKGNEGKIDSDDEDEEDHAEVIGTIDIFVRSRKESTGDVMVEKIEREVLSSREVYEGKPFYRAPNQEWMRVLIMDPSRIQYLSPQENIEDDEERAIEQMMEEERNPKIDYESVEMDELGPGSDPKIGTIVVQKALKPGEKVSEAKIILDVYGTPVEKGSFVAKQKRPYMLTEAGRRIEVKNVSVIRYSH